MREAEAERRNKKGVILGERGGGKERRRSKRVRLVSLGESGKERGKEGKTKEGESEWETEREREREGDKGKGDKGGRGESVCFER